MWWLKENTKSSNGIIFYFHIEFDIEGPQKQQRSQTVMRCIYGLNFEILTCD